jgi:hypothetical protein
VWGAWIPAFFHLTAPGRNRLATAGSYKTARMPGH